MNLVFSLKDLLFFFFKIVQMQWKLDTCSNSSHNLISDFWRSEFCMAVAPDCSLSVLSSTWQVKTEFSASLKQSWVFQEAPIWWMQCPELGITSTDESLLQQMFIMRMWGWSYETYLSEILLRRPYNVPTTEALLCTAKGDMSALQQLRGTHTDSASWTCVGTRALSWWDRGQMARSSLVSPSVLLQLRCFTGTAAVVSCTEPFGWINSSFLKSFVVQKCSAFWSDFLNSLTKVKRTLDVTQAAVSKNSLLFMNRCCLHNVVVTVPPGFAPQYCLCMLLLFVMPYLITTGCSSLSSIYFSSSFALKIMLISNKLKIYFWGNRAF